MRDFSKCLPIRDDVTEIECRRPPTDLESALGYGATHYRTFEVETSPFMFHKGTRVPKNGSWLLMTV